MNGVTETMGLSVVSKPSDKNNDLRMVHNDFTYRKDYTFIKSKFLLYVEMFLKTEFSFKLNHKLFLIKGDFQIDNHKHPLYGMKFIQIQLQTHNEGSIPKFNHNFIMDRVEDELKRLKPNFFWRMVKGRSIDIFDNTMVDKNGDVKEDG